MIPPKDRFPLCKPAAGPSASPCSPDGSSCNGPSMRRPTSPGPGRPDASLTCRTSGAPISRERISSAGLQRPDGRRLPPLEGGARETAGDPRMTRMPPLPKGEALNDIGMGNAAALAIRPRPSDSTLCGAPAAGGKKGSDTATRFVDEHLEHEPPDGMNPGQQRLAAYLLGCKVVGDSVCEELETVAQLVAANETVERVRQYMFLGRANVMTDIAATNYANNRTKQSCEVVCNRVLPKLSFYERIGVQAFRGTSHCGGFSNVAVATHATLPGDRVAYGNNDLVDHQWMLHVRGASTVVLDGWCEGPAVLKRHSAYMNRAVQPRITDVPPESRSKAHDDFFKGLSTIGPIINPAIERQIRYLDATRFKNIKPRKPESVFTRSFVERVKFSLSEPAPARSGQVPDHGFLSPSLRNEILAVNTARLVGADVKLATRAAPGIVKHAKTLGAVGQRFIA